MFRNVMTTTRIKLPFLALDCFVWRSRSMFVPFRKRDRPETCRTCFWSNLTPTQTPIRCLVKKKKREECTPTKLHTGLVRVVFVSSLRLNCRLKLTANCGKCEREGSKHTQSNWDNFVIYDKSTRLNSKHLLWNPKNKSDITIADASTNRPGHRGWSEEKGADTTSHQLIL